MHDRATHIYNWLNTYCGTSSGLLAVGFDSTKRHHMILWHTLLFVYSFARIWCPGHPNNTQYHGRVQRENTIPLQIARQNHVGFVVSSMNYTALLLAPHLSTALVYGTTSMYQTCGKWFTLGSWLCCPWWNTGSACSIELSTGRCFHQSQVFQF